MDGIQKDQKRVMSLLEPLMPRIYPIFPNALDKYNNKYPAEVKAEHESRTAAGCVRDHAWTEFKTEFMGEDGFHFLDIKGMNVLNIRDELVIRVKKVNANGLHSNYQTAQQKSFDKQEELPFLPVAASRVIVGYQPDVAFSEVERVIVRSPSKKWASQILEIDEAPSWVDITPATLPFYTDKHAARK